MQLSCSREVSPSSMTALTTWAATQHGCFRMKEWELRQQLLHEQKAAC